MQNEALSLLDLMICRIPGLKPNERIELEKQFDREEDFSVLSKRDIENLLGRFLESDPGENSGEGSFDKPGKKPSGKPWAKPWKMDEIRLLAEKDAELVRKYGLCFVSWREKDYPPLLREIFDPPAILFYRGSLPDPEKPLAAVVGTRKPSSQAAGQAFTLGRELAEAGIPVVSGLALGIDSMAHRGNIEGGAPTVAVLGSGVDQIYPSSNRNLARRALEKGGIILSEYPPLTKPFKSNFPARNRIISGMARGTVIVEAPEKSGALITARYALDQGRDLWVDRVGVSSPRGAGTARLAQEGAVVISSARDILAEWKMPAGNTVRSDKAGLASSMAQYLEIKL